MKWPWKRENWYWPHIFWINLFGWWGEEAESAAMRKWLLRVKTVSILYICVLLTSMSVAIAEKLAAGDIMSNLYTLYGIVPGVAGTFKLFFLIRHRGTLKSAMDQLDELLLDVDGPEIDEIVSNGLARCWGVCLAFLGGGGAIIIHWLSRPAIIAILYHEKTRILDTWPVFIDTWPQFAASYVYQAPNIIILGHSFYLFDNIYYCISELVLCHFSVLRCRLEQLTLTPDGDSSRRVTACVVYHEKILRICTLLRDASTTVIIYQCTNTVFMICAGVFIMIKSEDVNANLVMNLGETTTTVVIALYFYCWYSNEITLQCTEVTTNVYMSNWLNGTDNDKKSLTIIMARSKKPIYFGGILEINLNTFITVLKTSFSYYNFMVAVNTESDI